MPRYFPSELLAATIGGGGWGGGRQRGKKKCSFSFSRVGVKTIKLFQFLLGRQYDSEMVFDRGLRPIWLEREGEGVGVGVGEDAVWPRKYLNSQTGS